WVRSRVQNPPEVSLLQAGTLFSSNVAPQPGMKNSSGNDVKQETRATGGNSFKNVLLHAKNGCWLEKRVVQKEYCSGLCLINAICNHPSKSHTEQPFVLMAARTRKSKSQLRWQHVDVHLLRMR